MMLTSRAIGPKTIWYCIVKEAMLQQQLVPASPMLDTGSPLAAAYNTSMSIFNWTFMFKKILDRIDYSIRVLVTLIC